MDGLSINISAKRVAVWLAIAISVLAACHVLVMIVHYRVIELSSLFRDLFDLDEEQSFGTWFSAAMLLFAGLLQLAYALNLERDGRAGHKYWAFLGIGFCVLSLDEVVGLHETLNTIIDISWTLPGAVAAGIVALIYIPFLISLPVRTRWLFVLAGAVYLGGAIGVERATDWYADEDLLSTLEYNLTTVLEEAMEMTGVAIFIYASLSHIAGVARNEVAVEVEVV